MFVDRSYRKNESGNFPAGYAITTWYKLLEKGNLPQAKSVQQAELHALTRKNANYQEDKLLIFILTAGVSLGPSMMWGFSGGSEGKASACNVGDPGSVTESGRSLEKEMATHSSILAWRIPWMEEPDRLQSTGSQRVGHDWVTSLHFMIWGRYGNKGVFLYPLRLQSKMDNKLMTFLLLFSYLLNCIKIEAHTKRTKPCYWGNVLADFHVLAAARSKRSPYMWIKSILFLQKLTACCHISAILMSLQHGNTLFLNRRNHNGQITVTNWMTSWGYGNPTKNQSCLVPPDSLANPICRILHPVTNHGTVKMTQIMNRHARGHSYKTVKTVYHQCRASQVHSRENYSTATLNDLSMCFC